MSRKPAQEKIDLVDGIEFLHPARCLGRVRLVIEKEQFDWDLLAKLLDRNTTGRIDVLDCHFIALLHPLAPRSHVAVTAAQLQP